MQHKTRTAVIAYDNKATKWPVADSGGPKMEAYALALSGGGTRGAAHVGVLTALEEAGLLPSQAAGTSAGSIVAGLYSAGMEIGAMRETVQWLSRHKRALLDPDVKGILAFLPQLFAGREVALKGLLKGNRLSRFLWELTGGMELTDLPKGLLIPAVDLNSGDTVVFTNLFQKEIPFSALQQEHVKWERTGLLSDIMTASSSVPAVFCPRQMKSFRLVDGGVTNNLPVDLLIAAGVSRVLAVDTGAAYERPPCFSIMEIASHSFSIMSRELKDCRSSGELLLLKPRLSGKAGLLTFEQMEQCMEDGYTYTKQMLPRIRKALKITE